MKLESGQRDADEAGHFESGGRSPRVRRVYRFGSAGWYDWFRRAWTWCTSRVAEASLDQWLRLVASDGCRVIDIGCGTGFNVGRLQRLGVPFASYLGVDLTDTMLAVAREHYTDETRVTFLEADLEMLAGTSERFDVVLCTWVASHLDQPRQVFDLGYDLLAPSGQAFFLMMTRPRWYVRWWFAPFARLFQARFVDPEFLAEVPGLKRSETWTGGLVTLVWLEKPSASAAEATPVTSVHRGRKP